MVLFGISVLYIGGVRPLQSKIILDAVVPYFESRIEKNNSVIIGSVDVDELTLSGPFVPMKIELPFNGWFWLSVGLLASAGKVNSIKVITLYHLVLSLTLFLAAHWIIDGAFWISPFLNMHNHVYKVLFLIYALLASTDFLSLDLKTRPERTNRGNENGEEILMN